jgi:hypothetical protein
MRLLSRAKVTLRVAILGGESVPIGDLIFVVVFFQVELDVGLARSASSNLNSALFHFITRFRVVILQ